MLTSNIHLAGNTHMTKKEIIKSLNQEMKAIRRDVRKDGSSVRDWPSIDVDRMNPNEAFNRGYYRALTAIKTLLK